LWQEPKHQTDKSYEDKQMNQAKPVINIAEEFQQWLSDETSIGTYRQAARSPESREKRGRHTISEMPCQEALDG